MLQLPPDSHSANASHGHDGTVVGGVVVGGAGGVVSCMDSKRTASRSTTAPDGNVTSPRHMHASVNKRARTMVRHPFGSAHTSTPNVRLWSNHNWRCASSNNFPTVAAGPNSVSCQRAKNRPRSSRHTVMASRPPFTTTRPRQPIAWADGMRPCTTLVRSCRHELPCRCRCT
jgi:hypothetical protein